MLKVHTESKKVNYSRQNDLLIVSFLTLMLAGNKDNVTYQSTKILFHEQ